MTSGIKHLIIGGNGLIGTAIRLELSSRGESYVATTRRHDEAKEPFIYLDLADLAHTKLPRAETLYLVAAMPKFAECEGNPLAWQVNVDAQIYLASRYRLNCVIFISSDCVEWSSTAYARHKMHVEAFINSISGTIIRPSKVARERAGELAKVIVDAAEKRLPGVVRWK